VRRDQAFQSRGEVCAPRAAHAGQQAQPAQRVAVSGRQRVEGARERLELRDWQRAQPRHGQRRDAPSGQREHVVGGVAHAVALAQPSRVARAEARPHVEARRDRGLHPGTRVLQRVDLRLHDGADPASPMKSPVRGRTSQTSLTSTPRRRHVAPGQPAL